MPQPLCDGVGVSLISLTVVHDFDVKQFFGIFWSLVPYAFFAVLIFGLFFTQRLSLLVLVFFGLIMTAINEFAIKNIHDENRPEHSCLDSGGFPSGHAMIATLFLTWITIEVIIHPNWTPRKKVITLVGLWALLGPCPPFRHPGGDHSWTQIAAGVVVGVVSGLILFFFNQFVIIRHLEQIMQWRIIKFFHIRNDLRPNYEHSKYHGTKAPAQTSVAVPKKPHITSLTVFKVAHIIPISVNFALGIVGIIVGLVKKHREQCDRSSGTVTIGVGLWTLIAAIFMLVVFLLTLRKMNKKSWFPEGVQGFLFIGGLFMFEAFFWNVAAVATSREDNDCPLSGGGDMTLIYAIIWYAVQGVLLIFIVEMYYLLDIRRIYGFKKNCIRKSDGHGSIVDKPSDAPGTYNHDAPLEYQKGKNAGVPQGMNAV